MKSVNLCELSVPGTEARCRSQVNTVAASTLIEVLSRARRRVSNVPQMREGLQREGTLRGRLRRALKWADRSGIASPVLRDSVQAYQGRPPLAIAVLSNLLHPSAPTGQLQVVDAPWGYPAAQRFAAKRFQPSSSLAALPRSGRFHHDNERIFRDRLQLSPHCHHIAGFGLGVLCPIPKARAPYHDVADAGW